MAVIVSLGYDRRMHHAKITGFHQDDDGHWVAELDCGHNRHVRHLPPFQERQWVVSETGRNSKLDVEIYCGLCAQGE
jgi:hypothetical protein